MATRGDPIPQVVVERTVNLSAEVRAIWGAHWNEPTPEYEFSSGRRFVRRTEDAAIYETSPDF